MKNISKENYLKKIFVLTQKKNNQKPVPLNELVKNLNFKASSVTNMLKKLGDDKLIHYQPYKGVSLTAKGKQYATKMIRKHRLWEYFLQKKLKFDWTEVHEIAEQLEHIQSTKLIDRLEKYLDFPNYDPHGDPIPDKHGNFSQINLENQRMLLQEIEIGEKVEICQVTDGHPQLLKYLEELNLMMGTQIQLLKKNNFDQSIEIKVHQKILTLTPKVSENLVVKKVKN